VLLAEQFFGHQRAAVNRSGTFKQQIVHGQSSRRVRFKGKGWQMVKDYILPVKSANGKIKSWARSFGMSITVQSTRTIAIMGKSW